MNFDLKILQLLQNNAGTDMFGWNFDLWKVDKERQFVMFQIKNKYGFFGAISIREISNSENLFSLMFSDYFWNGEIAVTVLSGSELSKFITNLAGDHNKKQWSAGEPREGAKKEPWVQAEGGRAPQEISNACVGR